MTIEQLLIAGVFAGLPVGLMIDRHKIGCLALLVVPLAMFLYVGWWQSANPDKLNSTSGLDFMFGPLWPSLGALGGYYAGRLVRSWVLKSGD